MNNSKSNGKTMKKNSLQQFCNTNRNTCDQLKFILAKWAKVCDGSPVVNACKTEPEIT
jgi:hypothetical protein